MDNRNSELCATLQEVAADCALSNGTSEMAQDILKWLIGAKDRGDLRSDTFCLDEMSNPADRHAIPIFNSELTRQTHGFVSRLKEVSPRDA